MIYLKKNKKGVMLYQELILVVFSIVVIGISLFIVSYSSNASLDKISSQTLDLNYKFPATFIQSFLYQELSEDDKNKLNLNSDEIYFVKDIVTYDESKVKNILQRIRDEFILKEEEEFVADKLKSINKNKHFDKLKY